MGLDQFFLLIMGALVMFMQCGFAFLEAGAVRSKNVVNILIKNALDCFCGAVIYWAIGYAFAYGSKGTNTSTDAFIGSKYFFSIGMPDTDIASWFFQFVFAAPAATIVSGAVAERTQFGSYLVYSAIITGFVYPVVSHWGWTSEGWLQSGAPWEGVGFTDFAGSGIVHACGGIAALMGAVFIGPRVGKFSEDGTKQYSIPGHSVPVAALGGFILFLGFLAFNGGSQLAIVSDAGDAAAVALVFMNTMLGGAGGALSALTCNYISAMIQKETPYWSLLTCINGGLAGMVALCAGCNVMHQGAAFACGILGGFTMWWAGNLIKKLCVDDPLDAFAVHYGGGVVGLLFTPVFMNGGIVDWENCSTQEEAFKVAQAAAGTNEVFECNYAPFQAWVWNLVGLIAITLWSGVICGLMFFTLNLFGLLRVEEDIEIRGLDIKKHGEPAYPTAAYGHGWDAEGDFRMSNLNTGTQQGRRDIRALANPNDPQAWSNQVNEGGLIAMALGYQKAYYKGDKLDQQAAGKANEAYQETDE